MKQRIDKNKIRSEREKRGWSQEQLASVSGLGLRTIQRIEASGKSSLESGRALASVFEISLEDLWEENPRFDYDHVQVSYVFFTCFILIVPLLSIFFKTLSTVDSPDQSELFIPIVLLVAAIPLLAISSLRIQICEGVLRWRFGLGLLKKERRIANIESVSPVRNKWWYGWGIRMLPHCILYNAWGLDAVEVLFTDGSRLRLGTDEPETLSRAIQSSLAN